LARRADQISPDQASKPTPQQVQDVVEHAHQSHPGMADERAGFYAQHFGLIKTLGSAALAIATAKMKNHLSPSVPNPQRGSIACRTFKCHTA
jgi:hypothetical protein